MTPRVIFVFLPRWPTDRLARMLGKNPPSPDIPIVMVGRVGRRSLANSGGVHLGDSFHQDIVRLGVSLYGAAPNGERPSPVKPVVRLHARVVQVREVAAGQGVGYADGWSRTLSNQGTAYYQGARQPFGRDQGSLGTRWP